MKQINRLLVLTKRILSHTMYLLMIFSIILLTVIYKFLPEKSKSTDIKVDIFYEGDSSFDQQLKSELETCNSIYTFGETSSKNALIDSVKSGQLECGIYIPKNFFENYINGTCQNSKIVIYTIPETTLASSVIETVFSKILNIAADKILSQTVNIPEYNDAMEEKLSDYLTGDEIFKIESSTSGEYTFEDKTYKINIPVFEISVVYIVFATLLGLLLFQKDQERKMYVSQSNGQTQILKIFTILSAVLPLFLAGSVSILISYGVGIKLLIFMLITLAAYAVTLALSFIIRKSTLLSKVLPLVALITTITIFVIELF